MMTCVPRSRWGRGIGIFLGIMKDCYLPSWEPLAGVYGDAAFFR